MKSFLRKCLMACMMLLVSQLSMAQSSTVTHIVDRGETLESIAQQYNTTVDAIIQLNPDAAQFIYVGMELTIPSRSIGGSVNGNYNSTQSYSSSTSGTGTTYYQGNSYRWGNDFKHWRFALHLGAGIMPKTSAIKTSGITTMEAQKMGENINISVGANYFPISQLYIGLRAGWDGAFRKNLQSHFVTIPFEVGGKFNVTDNLALMPYFGLDLNVCVSYKTKSKSSSSDGGDDNWWEKYLAPSYSVTRSDYDDYEDYINSITSANSKIKEKAAKGSLSVGVRLGLRLSFGKDTPMALGFSCIFPGNGNQKLYLRRKTIPEISYSIGF